VAQTALENARGAGFGHDLAEVGHYAFRVFGVNQRQERLAGHHFGVVAEDLAADGDW